jgi:hypothetical protein
LLQSNNFLAGTLEIGVALTAAALLLWVHLSLMEEYRSRVERVLSSPAGSRDACCNMRLSAALGAALFLTKGSCPETVVAWTSAFEIAESLDDADYRLRALWACLSRASLAAVIRRRWRWPERFCAYAEQSADPADGPVGDRLVGAALLALGDLEGARRHVERMLGRCVARKSHSVRFHYDQRLLACSYHSLILGHKDLPIMRYMASSAFWSTLAPAITQCRCPVFSAGHVPSRFSRAI